MAFVNVKRGIRSNSNDGCRERGRERAVNMSDLLIPANQQIKIWLWFLFNFIFPLSPFFLGGFIHLLTVQKITWETFNASQLAMSIAFQSVFIGQSLLQNERLLDNEDKKSEVEGMSFVYFLSAFLYIVIFAIIEFAKSLMTIAPHAVISSALHAFELTVYSTFLIPIIQSYRTQKGFRLKVG